MYQYWLALHGRTNNQHRRALYQVCKRAISSLAQKFGISAKQLGQNLEADFHEFTVENPDRSPTSLAEDYICDDFQTTDQVLKAARFLLSYEILHDPVVCKYLWEVYEKLATVSTRPTPKGREVIDTYHPYRGIRRTEGKPAFKFTDSEFLLMLKAEREGLILISLELPDEQKNQLLDALQRNYFSTRTDERAEVWNEQRSLILEQVLAKKLVSWERDLRETLTTQAKAHALERAQLSLERLLRRGPFRPPPDTFAPGEGVDEMRMLVVVWNRPEPMAGVLLDSSGRVVSSLQLPFFPVGREKDLDIATLREFILKHLPHAIVVAITDMGSKRLHEEMGYIIRDLLNENRDYIAPHLTYASSTAARVCANSKPSLTEHGATSQIALRQAVSVGRMLLDPLAELSNLCNRDSDLLALKLHPLEDDIQPKADVVNALHRVFINMTNGIGVDLNDVYNNPHKAGMLQFVAGFGPRKAKHFLEVMQHHGEVSERRQLRSELGLGPVLYTNCAGFIRLMNAETPLDRTRIHPEDYTIATKMAGDCLDREPGDENYDLAISDVMWNPSKLETVSVEAFAKELEERNNLLKFLTLQDIQKELTHPAAEIRLPYRDLGTERDTDVWDEFKDAAGITEEPGQAVTVTIIAMHSGGLTCRFDNGLIGKIGLHHIADPNSPPPSPRSSDSVREDRRRWVESKIGDSRTIQCKILVFMKEKDQLFAELAMDPQTMEQDTEGHYLDSYLKEKYPWMLLPAEEQQELARARRQAGRAKSRRLRERKITHPMFKNLTLREALVCYFLFFSLVPLTARLILPTNHASRS